MRLRYPWLAILVLASYTGPSIAYIIDDSQWATPALQLSPGWNMLRPSQVETIDPFEAALMRPLLPLFHNQSISWTRSKGANYTLRFTGTSLAIHAPRGPSGARYGIILDASPVPGTFDGYAPVFTPNQTVWRVDGLEMGEHVVSAVHEGEGYMYFDYADVSSTPPVSSSSGTPQSTTPPAVPAIELPSALSYDPAALQRLTEVYEFKMTGPLYFVITFTAVMLLLALTVIFSHRRHTTLPHMRKPFLPLPTTTSGPLKSLKHRLIRKSHISPPLHAPRGAAFAPFEDELVFAPPVRKLRPRDAERDAEEGGGGMTLADALREEEP